MAILSAFALSVLNTWNRPTHRSPPPSKALADLRQQVARASDQASRQELHDKDLLDTAQLAAQRGDVHQVWKVVRTLAPKVKRKPLQLYRNGHIMAPEAELDWIIEAFGERYGAREPPNTTSIRKHQPVQVSVAEVWYQLEHLPVRKAVPRSAAPSVVWRACSSEVASFIAQQVNTQWQQAELHIEQDWANASVALLPKPKRKNDKPLEWRPIGLQHSIGKGLMKLLITKAKDQIYQLVYCWPQCAYVPHRNTFTALKRVLNHCRHVRDQAAKYRVNVHQQHAGIQPVLSSGGLQVCMNLTAAFDSVSWCTIREALELAQIDPSIQEVLLQWLSQVKYIFQHQNLEKEIWPSWGLRQGCIGSPVLWSAFTALLCRAIDLRVRQQWCSEHATLYADDSHLRWTFQTVGQFEHAIQAILSLTGDFRHKIQQLYIRKQDGIRRLLLSPGDPSEWIPLVDKAEYLGLIVSYEQFEWQSVRHRVTKAHKRRWALASLLHAKRVSITYKLRLWRSCVLSTMMYALHCLCLQPGHTRHVQRAIMKHVRAITSDQAFLTGRTHDTISTQYEVKSAHDLLLQAHENELQIAQLGDWILEHEYNQEPRMDDDMAAFFGGVRESQSMGPFPPDPFQDYSTENPLDNGPNKRRREPFAGHRHQNNPFGRSPFNHYAQAQLQTQHRDPLLHTLTKTVLRQQEELRLLRQDTAFIIFLKPGQDSIMHHLYQVAVQFKAKQEAEPTWSLGQFPLRMVLANALFRELIERLNKVPASQEKLKAVTEQGWRDDRGWRFQVWNRTLRHLEHDRARPPIPDDQLLDHLATITQCLKAVVITRFCCTRKMTETMTSPATFKMDISMRSHSALTMWDTMRALQGNAVFQLVGMGFKTQSLGRGPEEQRLRDMVFGRRYVFVNRTSVCYMNSTVQVLLGFSVNFEFLKT
ncbi:unnamed protein product [Symbiodinium sp. CCMP2456]|nr:unnamed protein product [Symbiodinium sp. CCMP2456]